MTKARWIGALSVLLVLNAGYLWAFAQPNLFYVGNVLAHVAIGAILAVLAFTQRSLLKELWQGLGRVSAVLLGVAAVLGVVLCFIGATYPHIAVVVIHGAAGFLGMALAAAHFWGKRPDFGKWVILAVCLALLMPAGEALRHRFMPTQGKERIINPTTAPLSMDGEGGGPDGPFFPSSATTNVGGLIPSEFFLDSKACGECHVDIYEQWESSMHHFSSFNNQFYRKAIEYMQETEGVQSSKWCAGCHDHAMFFNGRFEKPAIEQIDTPQAHAGLGCMSCHSITHVPSTMGNGGFEMTYPPLHELMTTKNKLVHALNEYVTNTAPAAHRTAFMKPFMQEDTSEFCSTCHKVHLDKPVNNYRWFRGFNTYDNWQGSGVSGFGARSFYYPPASQTCADCHMPLVDSHYPGAKNGKIRSHNFAAANTAVPYVNQDETQLKATTDFLTNDIVSVDIFAVSPVMANASGPEMRRTSSDEFQMATTFAVGEESGNASGPVVIRDVGEISAPVDRTQPTLQAGSKVKVDVVVRTKKVGHFFPSGTVDSFDVWVELKATDATGKPIFWSGEVEDGGKGPVEPGAHFYRSYMLDAHGNPIDKRNAFHARTVLYARLIPPGAADTVHYEMAIPADAKGPIKVEAKLNYRKFAHSYTQFAYAGKANDDGEFGKDFDDRTFDYSPENIPANVSGKIKDRIPELPIVVMASDTVELALGEGETVWKPAVQADDYIRWNDYGIGLLLQGDIRGAQYAFERVTEAKPDYADGWLNMARALLLEGRPGDARPFINKAMEIDGSLARVHFFKAMADKREGLYDDALENLRFVESQYPKDRVTLNEIARILFLRREYQNALGYLGRVAEIDPEDLQMHYTAMLCYRGLGDAEQADREKALFERFKIDEKSQVIAGDVRRQKLEDNNERNPLHAHVSVKLP